MNNSERQTILQDMKKNPPDIIIAGGGITGAGILREAAMAGLRVLLVESMDFSSGSSSASSKLVHGGLRYLQNGQFMVTYRSVRERELLMKELPGLVHPLDFVLPVYSLKNTFLYKIGLWIYDRFAGSSYHHRISRHELLNDLPGIRDGSLRRGYVYYDAQTDDTRMVFRIMHDAIVAGGHALNYCFVEKPIFSKRNNQGNQQNQEPESESSDTLHNLKGDVAGALIKDRISGKSYSIPCKVLVNATGFNTDQLRLELGLEPVIRPLRGSHIVFSKDRFPVGKATGFSHPHDKRNVFVLPWMGVVIVGTTDLDHKGKADEVPGINSQERSYLLDAINHVFPYAFLTEKDIISTWAGVRPVVSSGVQDPSKESRDMLVHYDRNLLTVTGGKLTTFRNEAIHALNKLGDQFPVLRDIEAKPFENPSAVRIPGLHEERSQFLATAYGPLYQNLINMQKGKNVYFPGTVVPQVVARFALKYEWVQHLDDLMIRRTRLGLVLPEGGKAVLPMIQKMAREAGWSESRWKAEEKRYSELVAEKYS